MPESIASHGTDGEAYRRAYWRAFDRFFGGSNAAVVKAMLLAKYPHGDHGDDEVDRVAYGLRHTMGWIADAIDRAARAEAPTPGDIGPKRRLTAEPEES